MSAMGKAFRLVMRLILPFAIGWQCVYWVAFLISPYLFPTTFQKLNDAKGEKGYWAASVVSTVHAIVITIVSACAFWQETSLLYSDDWFQTTPLSMLSCFIFAGYMLSDTLVSLYFNSRWKGWEVNLMHHVTVTLTWTLLAMGGYSQCIALLMHLMEITTPCVNLRWFLDKAGLKTGRLYFYNGLTMVFVWFLVRILGYMYASKQLYVQRAGLLSIPLFNQISYVLCFVIGFLLQCFWFSKLARGAMKALKAPIRTSAAPGATELLRTPEMRGP